MNKAAQINDFPVPQSYQAELALLNEIISAPEHLQLAAGIVSAEMFSNDELRKVWQKLQAMHEAKQTIDYVTIAGAIAPATLALIMGTQANCVGTYTSVTSHASALRDAALRRAVYSMGVKAIQAASGNTMGGAELMTLPEDLMADVRELFSTAEAAESLNDVINDLADQIQQTANDVASGKRPRVTTSFAMLDYLTYGGFNAGNLVILAARPSVGKTAVMLQMARAAASTEKAAAIFNLEMMGTELAQRLLFASGTITPKQIADGSIDWNCFEHAVSRLPKNVYINDKARKIDEIISAISTLHRQGRCDIAFIDYLGLSAQATDNGSGQLYRIIGAITSRLKQTAKDCRIPIVLLCQLNREVEQAEHPALRHLRDSGSIEQDADIVLMLEKDEAAGELLMWVRKNRQGKAGEVCIRLRVNSTYTEFAEVET